MQVATEFTDASCAPVEEAVEVFFDFFACAVKTNGDAVSVCADDDVCLCHKVERLVVEGFEVKAILHEVLEDVKLRVTSASGASSTHTLVEDVVFGVDVVFGSAANGDEAF